MRRIARFWAVYNEPEFRFPPDFVCEFWDLFSAPGPGRDLAYRLNDYKNGKDIPY